MTDPTIAETFDVGKIADSGVRAIVDALRIDRENVLAVDWNQQTHQLRLEFASPAVAERTRAFVGQMMQTHHRIARKVVREHRAACLQIHDIDAALAGSPEVLPLGAGLCGLRGSLLGLFRFFEREFLRMAHEFGADENHYPVMIPEEILAEVGYFQHFPQHVTFCCHLPDNLSTLEAFSRDVKVGQGKLPDDVGSLLARPAQVLTPGVCLPCYRQLRNTVLGPGEVRTLTMQNHVFRYEGANFRPLTRGWDFTVRDIVFFGDYKALRRRRLDVLDRAMQLCQELDLEVTVELANDPFFLDSSRDKAIYQRMGEVKYELLFPLPYRGESLAAASFNLHRDFYTSIYQTRQSDGQLAESACMGFGFDRWVYGFLSQKGFDPQRWPKRVAACLGEG